VESAVSAHLANAAVSGACQLIYRGERSREVSFGVKRGRTLTAIEVNSGPRRDPLLFESVLLVTVQPPGNRPSLLRERKLRRRQ